MGSSSSAAGEFATTSINNMLKPTPIFDLPRELRDKIYEHVLLDVGTLFLGVRPLNTSVDTPPESSDHPANNHPANSYPASDNSVNEESASDDSADEVVATTLVDIRFQQRFNPLPLLGVSRTVRAEFLEAMVRHGRKGRICPFSMEEGTQYFGVWSGLCPWKPKEVPIKRINTDALSSWSLPDQSTSGSLQVIYAVLKWQTDQTMLIRKLLIRRSGDISHAEWTCCYNGPEATMEKLQFTLVLRAGLGLVGTYTLHFVKSMGKAGTAEYLRGYLEVYDHETCEGGGDPFNMVLFESTDTDSQPGPLHCYPIHNSPKGAMRHLKTAADVLVFKMSDVLGSIFGEETWLTGAELLPSIDDDSWREWCSADKARMAAFENGERRPS